MEDYQGKLVGAGTGGQTVNLTSTSLGGVFYNSTGTAEISSLTIPAGSDTASFTYKDLVAGTPTLTAAATGLASGTQQETVAAAMASKLVFTTSAQTLSAGAAFRRDHRAVGRSLWQPGRRRPRRPGASQSLLDFHRRRVLQRHDPGHGHHDSRRQQHGEFHLQGHFTPGTPTLAAANAGAPWQGHAAGNGRSGRGRQDRCSTPRPRRSRPASLSGTINVQLDDVYGNTTVGRPRRPERRPGDHLRRRPVLQRDGHGPGHRGHDSRRRQHGQLHLPGTRWSAHRRSPPLPPRPLLGHAAGIGHGGGPQHAGRSPRRRRRSPPAWPPAPSPCSWTTPTATRPSPAQA